MNDNDLWRMREDIDRLSKDLREVRQVVLILSEEVRELRALVTPLDPGRPLRSEAPTDE